MAPGIRADMEKVAKKIHDEFRHLHAVLQVRWVHSRGCLERLNILINRQHDVN